MENIEIARTFDEVADLLDIQGANPFRVRAYRAAARTIGALDNSVESILKRNGHAQHQHRQCCHNIFANRRGLRH